MKNLKLYPFIVKLNVYDNQKITDISHLIHLQILHAADYCGIDNNCIKLLTNLVELKSAPCG